MNKKNLFLRVKMKTNAKRGYNNICLCAVSI